MGSLKVSKINSIENFRLYSIKILLHYYVLTIMKYRIIATNILRSEKSQYQ